ncbi:hypothetical protein GO986_18615 [Deinococcus sp. HMF7620]|uniref:Uncharacterized protein n=1 Tax=Deinococcus arboris TaxID=2682977 RepID=A0A7C9I1M8_9DEIO|nr:hypothetical protein [Deinococcus arboris]MVN88755.1 hypothetical protein [Deinococcus arboris]
MSPTTWTKEAPRVGVSVRVYPEYRTALDAFTRRCQASGMDALQRYDVLEYLMRDLLTDEGRQTLLHQLSTSPTPIRRNGQREPRGMLSARVHQRYMQGLEALLESSLGTELATLERYRVLEYLMRDLLTEEGQRQVQQALLQQRPS